MYENELEFINQHLDLIDQNKFEELFNLASQQNHASWQNIMTIFYDPDVNINPLEGMVEIPHDFFRQCNLSSVDLVVPKSVNDIPPSVFYNSSFKSIRFDNPDCIVRLSSVTADTIIMPTNSKLDNTSGNYLADVNAKVVLSKVTSAIDRGAIIGACPNLILIWTSPNKVLVSLEYAPKNKNPNWWKANKNTLKIRR